MAIRVMQYWGQVSILNSTTYLFFSVSFYLDNNRQQSTIRWMNTKAVTCCFFLSFLPQSKLSIIFVQMMTSDWMIMDIYVVHIIIIITNSWQGRLCFVHCMMMIKTKFCEVQFFFFEAFLFLQKNNNISSWRRRRQQEACRPYQNRRRTVGQKSDFLFKNLRGKSKQIFSCSSLLL